MQSGKTGSVFAGVIGGAIVAAVFAVLLVTGVIRGEEKTVVQQAVGTPSSAGGVKTVNQIYKEAGPGVVAIQTKVSSGGDSLFAGQQGVASGSGAVVDKRGYIVTNSHVVEGATGAPRVKFGDDFTATAKIVGSDPSNDLAVLKVDVDKKRLHPLPLGDSKNIEVGNPVVAIGNPFGLDRTVTTGIVSALQRQITAPNNFTINNVIQTDAAINPGNSGGPLLDAEGRIIGINSQIATTGGSQGNVGIGFAVPIDTVKRVLPQLEDKGKVDYAYLGVSTQSLTPEVAGKLNYAGFKQGALVACVVDKGPADKAGLKEGSDSASIDGTPVPIGADLIIAIDGKPVKSSDDIQSLVTAKKPGDKIKITVVRDGKKRDLEAKLASRPAKTDNNCSRQQPGQP
jgi:S1-C subfamily serine protease